MAKLRALCFPYKDRPCLFTRRWPGCPDSPAILVKHQTRRSGERAVGATCGLKSAVCRHWASGFFSECLAPAGGSRFRRRATAGVNRKCLATVRRMICFALSGEDDMSAVCVVSALAPVDPKSSCRKCVLAAFSSVEQAGTHILARCTRLALLLKRPGTCRTWPMPV